MVHVTSGQVLCDGAEAPACVCHSTDLANGYTVLPAGKLANAVVWLEMRARPVGTLAKPLRLRAVEAGDLNLCNALYAVIGTPWLWTRAYETRATVEDDDHFILDDDGGLVGLVQFTGRGGPEVELAYFGLRPDATGVGLGRRAMAGALDLAWVKATRVWLHTCNFDHPSALRFYRACGFTPYASGFEIMDDPRSAGQLPADAAPHVPLIR